MTKCINFLVETNLNFFWGLQGGRHYEMVLRTNMHFLWLQWVYCSKYYMRKSKVLKLNGVSKKISRKQLKDLDIS